jgi:hypothetical protein
MPAPSTLTSTTQQFLDIYDITNDLLIMKDGATSLVITVSAMNFGLLAEEEQDAIMYSYAGLLNSLNYPIQIVIRSQTKDATKYLNLLKDQEEKASSELKRRAIEHYRQFVSNLIRERNVLDKKFYVAIPANSLEMGLLPPQTVVPGVKSIDISTVERSVIIEKARNILEPKRDHLIAQFNRIGLFARQLNTQEIIQLFYTSYNPEAAEGQQLTDTANYTTPLISTQGGATPMTAITQPTASVATPVTPPEPTTSTPASIPTPPMSPPPPAMPTSPAAPDTSSEPLAMPTPITAPPTTPPAQPTTVFSAPTPPPITLATTPAMDLPKPMTTSGSEPQIPTAEPPKMSVPTPPPMPSMSPMDSTPPAESAPASGSTPAMAAAPASKDDALPVLPEI